MSKLIVKSSLAESINRADSYVDSLITDGVESSSSTTISPSIGPMPWTEGQQMPDDVKSSIKLSYRGIFSAFIASMLGTEWVDVSTFESGWSGSLIGDTSYQNAQYKKDGLGIVRLRGIVTKDASIITPPSTIFTLPDGFRPKKSLVFPVMNYAALGQIRVLSSGVVAAYGGNFSAIPTWWDTSTICFEVE